MVPNRGQTNASKSSLDSLGIGHHLKEDDSDTDSSHFKMTTPLVAKRSFQFYHQAVADIRESTVNLRLWFSSALFLAAVEIVISTLPFTGFYYGNYCTVDGSFRLGDKTNLWAISDFFQVNIAAGNLTFTQAKIVDTIWDLIVGRCGQATLSLITWKVFAEYAAVSMTIRPITFATYRVLFADHGPSISSTARLLHDFIKFKALASKLASTFLIYSILFVLAVPTLVSSATGYTPLNEAFVQAYDGNLVPVSSFAYSIEYYGPTFPWVYSNRTYPKDDIEQRGVCVPVKDRYQWGASFLQIFLLLIFIGIWAIGCLALLISIHARYRVTKDTEAPKGYRALAILVGSIDEQLTDSNVNVSTTTDQQLKTAIKTKLAGGSMSFNAPAQIITFRQWYAKERTWFICLCVSVVCAIAFGIAASYYQFFVFFSIPLLYLSVGTLFAIIVGQTLWSRLFLLLCWVVPGVGITLGYLPIPPSLDMSRLGYS